MTHWRKRTLPAIYSWLLGTFTPINEIISGGESVHEAFEKLQGQISLNNKVSIHKPIEFSTDIEINSSNIDTYNGATLFLTSADENKNITVTEDAGITEDIAVVQCGNATATWVAGTNVVINNNKKTNGIGTATALTKRVAANTFDVIGGVE
jgi:hypothetical protein